MATHQREIELLVGGRTPFAAWLVLVDADVAGFAEARLRSDPVNGCETSPVAFLEGLWVAAPFRRRGVARAFIAVVEGWARSLGCVEFASDALIDNAFSYVVHLAVGFVETERVVCFRKQLVDEAETSRSVASAAADGGPRRRPSRTAARSGRSATGGKRDMIAPFSGGCACGSIRYVCSRAPVAMLNCHCRDCQRSSAAPFASGVVVVVSDTAITGTPKTYSVRGRSGRLTTRSFCPDCGAPLFTRSESAPEWMSIRSATLDHQADFQPMLDIWTASAQPWVCLSQDIPHHPESPR